MSQESQNKRLSSAVTLPNCFPTEIHAKRRKTRLLLVSAGLDDLPEELIVIILEATASHDIHGRPKNYYKTLHSLCLTNRKYYRLASPYLYSCINNRYVGTGKALKSLAKQPQLGRNVKGLYWLDDKIFSDYTWDAKLPYRLSQKERYEFHKIIEGTRLAGIDICALRRAIRRQSPDDLLSIFLLLSPNVEVLDVVDDNVLAVDSGGWHSPSWLRLLTLASHGSLDATQNFQHLSHIVVRMGPVELETVVPLLRLPSLRVLELTNAVQIGPMAGAWQNPGHQDVISSSLKSLLVMESIIDADAICQILDMIKGLKEFHFEWQTELRGFEEHLSDQSLSLSYHSLRDALCRHSSTLESLCIIDREPDESFDYFDLDYLNKQNWLGSLQEMQNVREFEVSLRAFRDLCDTLPPNIECLKIHIEDIETGPMPDQVTWWIDSLSDLSEVCKEINPYPRLKKITVPDNPIGVLCIDDDAKDLRASFTEQGISLVVEGKHPITPDLLFTRPLRDQRI